MNMLHTHTGGRKKLRIQPMRFWMSLLLALAVFFSGAAIPSTAVAQSGDVVYTVQSGDTLSTIAFRHGTTVSAILEANPGIQDANLIFPGQRLTIPEGPILPDTGTRDTPAVQIVRVVAGQSVTIRTQNFPANVTFDVLMNESGTRGIGGVRVDRITTGSRGDFSASFRIPQELRTDNRIVIRLDSPTTSFFSFNTFTNQTQGRRDSPGRQVPIAAQRSRDISFGQEVDFFLGGAGVYMPSSNYNGTLGLARLSPRQAESVKNLHFTQRLLQVDLEGPGGQSIPAVLGINYVYFNLDRGSRAAFERGNLDIYHFNDDLDLWERCTIPVLITGTNEPHGRLACVMTSAQGFNLYALAEQR
jgi:LysM repeat protein